MLTATFSCFKGLSASAEARLWQSGIFHWSQFPTQKNKWLSTRKTLDVKNQIAEARVALDSGLADWFLNRLQGPAKTRVYPHFKDGLRYIDIETTGLGRDAKITTIAVYDGKTLAVFIQNINLHEFPGILKGAKLLVTFNGARFDLPFLRKCFKLDIQLPHIDLLPVVKKLGYHGGLKKCEKKMGINRQIKDDMTGEDAVMLWKRYAEKEDTEALRCLVSYNCQDAVNLEAILVNTYNLEMQNYPIFRKMVVQDTPDIQQPFQLLFDK